MNKSVLIVRILAVATLTIFMEIVFGILLGPLIALITENTLLPMGIYFIILIGFSVYLIIKVKQPEVGYGLLLGTILLLSYGSYMSLHIH